VCRPSQLLDTFTEQDLEDYNDFREEHEGWIEKENMNHDELQRKMRLLTFASLAASTPSRVLEYKQIIKALQIPANQVEVWIIDVIKAGLVQGKMDQRSQTFKVHMTTYRVFTEKQWRELGTRMEQWKRSLRNVQATLERAAADVEAQREREQQEVDRKLQNLSMGDGGGQQGGQRRDRRGQQQHRERKEDDD
jgi:translation initiation factor 3 subunit M